MQQLCNYLGSIGEWKRLDERAFCYTIDEFVQGFERVKLKCKV